MRFMMIVKANKDSEAGKLPDPELLAAMMKFNEEMVTAGVLRAGEGLQASSKGARIEFSGGQRKVVKGPFTGPGELIAGFWIIEVKSLDDAIAWARRAPAPHGDDVETNIEIRPVFEAEDFGEAMTPELKETEARLRTATSRVA